MNMFFTFSYQNLLFSFGLSLVCLDMFDSDFLCRQEIIRFIVFRELRPSIMQQVLAARETVVNSYRRRRINIMAQGFPLLSPVSLSSDTHLSLKREVGQLHTPQASLMVSHYTTVPSLGLRIAPACEAGLSTGMQRERMLPHRRKKEKERKILSCAKICQLSSW